MKFSKPQSRIYVKKTTPKHIVGKQLKTKNKREYLESSRRKMAHYVQSTNTNDGSIDNRVLKEHLGVNFTKDM